MTTKAAIYARVSTEEQTTSNQIAHLRGMAEARGFDLVNVYQENGTAWKNGHQVELQKLITSAQRGHFNVVLVWALDRLTREGPLACLTLVNKLSSWGIKLLSYQEPWTDAPGELGELLFALTAWVARYESQRRSERTRAGLDRKKAEGFTLGRPPGSRDKRQRRRKRARAIRF